LYFRLLFPETNLFPSYLIFSLYNKNNQKNIKQTYKYTYYQKYHYRITSNISTTESTKIILKSNKNWNLWFYIKASITNRVWKYYDLYIKREDFPKLVEPVEPIYNNIKIIILTVIFIIINSSSSVKTPA
jgi:hypothetical protein